MTSVATKLKEWNESLEYLMDPVLGDEGRLYVKPEIVDAFKELIQLATIIVPNAYEAELLTSVEIRSIADGFKACDILHSKGPHTVIITSLQQLDTDEIVVLASTKKPRALKFTIRVPKIKAYFTGTGDLLASLILAAMGRHPSDLATAMEEAIASLQAVLRDTAEACGEASFALERTSEVCRARELRLVQNRAHLMNPPKPSPFKAVPWPPVEEHE